MPGLNRMSGIRLLDWPDIRENQCPVHPYLKSCIRIQIRIKAVQMIQNTVLGSFEHLCCALVFYQIVKIFF
jgi:hypothetical protein